jgi:hypothetical protein
MWGNIYTGQGNLPLEQSSKMAVSAEKNILFYFWNNQAHS